MGAAPTIDPEFRDLITPLAGAELHQLEENLLADGCRDPLVIWKDHGILLDGHHRLTICQKHGIEYRTAEVDLPDRDAAKLWMVANQFGRRDMTNFARIELVRKVRPIIEAQARARQVASGGAVVQKSAQPGERTRDTLATMAGVSHDTFTKAEYLDDNADDDVKQKLRAGETSINREHGAILQREEDERFAKYAIYPDLPPVLDALLRANIDRFGVLVPVVKDQHGNILDGHQRMRIAKELGIKYPVSIIEVADDDEALEIARTLNEDRGQPPPGESPDERFERLERVIREALEMTEQGVDRLAAMDPAWIADSGRAADTIDMLDHMTVFGNEATRTKAETLKRTLSALASYTPDEATRVKNGNMKRAFAALLVEP